MEPLSWAEFEKLDVRVGTVLAAQTFAKARKPAYQLSIDFGPELGVKKSSAQITKHYTAEGLVGQQVVAVVNFPPKNIAGFLSECLVLGLYDDNNEVVLLGPKSPVTNGRKMG